MLKIDDKKSEKQLPQSAQNPGRVGAGKGEDNGGDMGIYGFSEAIIKELAEENIPSIPKNYSIFFEKILEKQPDDFKKKVGEIIKIEDEIGRLEDDRQISIEREVKNSFIQIKSMLQAVALIYKNLSVLKTVIKKRLDSLDPNGNLLANQSVFNAFSDDLAKLNTLMDKHIEVIKTSYDEVGKVFKIVEEQSVYDPKFDIYNRKFFLKTLEMEVGNIQKYGYKSSLMLIKPKETSLQDIGSKGKHAVLKNISRMLLRTSRRSDIVGAQKACERITEMFYGTSFMLNDEKIDFDMEVVACALGGQKTVEELLSSALDALKDTGKDGKRYLILPGEGGK